MIFSINLKNCIISTPTLDLQSLNAFGIEARNIFANVQQAMIVACGTSYHADMIARSWFEEIAGIFCQVEVASEYRYRHVIVQPNTLFLTISQSGETADTLAALRLAKQQGYRLI
jgi:glutamine---fructose-6-phosphate transaminase (isomerizing)